MRVVRGRPDVDSQVQDVTVEEAADLHRDPYPLFARRRRDTGGIFRGSVMDCTKTP